MLESVYENSQDTEKEVSQDLATLSLADIFFTFLKIGSVAFGGFMSLISVIEDAVVKRRQLIAHHEILDGISLANLLPGPIAVNVVAFVGYRLRGGLGAFAAMTGASPMDITGNMSCFTIEPSRISSRTLTRS